MNQPLRVHFRTASTRIDFTKLHTVEPSEVYFSITLPWPFFPFFNFRRRKVHDSLLTFYNSMVKKRYV